MWPAVYWFRVLSSVNEFTPVNSKYTGTIAPMITAYDWGKPASDKNNFQKDSGEF